MGLIDALSGKTYKRNILINKNLDILLTKSKNEDDKVYLWLNSIIVPIGIFVETLLIDDKSDQTELIRNNTSKIDAEKVLTLMKFLILFTLYLDKKGEYAKEYGITKKSLEKAVLEFTDANEEIVKMYLDLSKDRTDFNLIADGFYNNILTILLGIKREGFMDKLTESLYILDLFSFTVFGESKEK